MSHSIPVPDSYRSAAVYVVEILRGAPPGDLAIGAAYQVRAGDQLQALGLTIPPSLLQRADQVIE
jgi:ABC-type uncharacterized transport system substrate-binding protein